MVMKYNLLIIGLCFYICINSSDPENDNQIATLFSPSKIDTQEQYVPKNSDVSAALKSKSPLLQDPELLDDDYDSTVIGQKRATFWQQNPGFIAEITDLTEGDIEEIKDLIMTSSRLNTSGGLDVTDIFPPNYESQSSESIKDYLQSLYKFLVYRDKETKKILGLLIYIEYENTIKKVSIQLFLTSGDVDRQYTFLLFPELEKICKAKKYDEISVIPTSEYQNFFYMRHGYRKKGIFNELVKTLK